MIDVSSALYDYLLTQSAITDLVGSGDSNRIYLDTDTPDKIYRPESGPSILFNPRGGLTDYSQCVYKISYKFKCYGDASLASTAQRSSAFNTYKAVHDALIDQSFGGGTVRHGKSEITYQIMEEFALNWVYALAFFRFLVVDDGS